MIPNKRTLAMVTDQDYPITSICACLSEIGASIRINTEGWRRSTKREKAPNAKSQHIGNIYQWRLVDPYHFSELNSVYIAALSPLLPGRIGIYPHEPSTINDRLPALLVPPRSVLLQHGPRMVSEISYDFGPDIRVRIFNTSLSYKWITKLRTEYRLPTCDLATELLFLDINQPTTTKLQNHIHLNS